MTLNELEWLFCVKFCFHHFMPVWLAPTMRLSKNNCVKCQRRKYSVGLYSFWQYKVCADIRSDCLDSRMKRLKDSVVAR